MMQTVRFGNFRFRVPSHPVVRIILGILLVLLGFFGFLPVLGFWMIPVGLVILSVDFSWVRRKRRMFSVWLGLRLAKRWPRVARAMGFGPLRDKKTG